jgi:hypothetical protein
MGLLILNTLSSIWKSLGGMRGRRGRPREDCIKRERNEKQARQNEQVFFFQTNVYRFTCEEYLFSSVYGD